MKVRVAKRRRVPEILLSLPHEHHDNCHVSTKHHSNVEKKRESGQPAWRIAGIGDLNRREKELADLIMECWEETKPLVETLVTEMFPIGPVTSMALNDESQYDLNVHLVTGEYQERFREVLLDQYLDSGEYSMREFTKQLSKEYKRFKKVTKADDVLPSEAIMRFRFDRTSPTAEAYAVKSSASMVTDLADTNIAGVRSLVGRAFQEQRTYQQTATALTALLSEAVPLNSVSQRLGSVYGINANGLFPRYANAVANFAEQTALDLTERGITGSKALKIVQQRSDKYANKLRRSRAKMISRTEIMRANNAGRLHASDQASAKGLFDRDKAKRQWITAPQDACYICGPLNGVAVPYNESWYEGEPAFVHPNCRCTWLLIPNVPVYGVPTVSGDGTASNPFVWNFANQQNQSLAGIQTGGATASGAPDTIPDPKPMQSTAVTDEVAEVVDDVVPIPDEITDIDEYVDNFVWDDAGRKWADLDIDEQRYLTDTMIDVEVQKAVDEISTLSHFQGDQGYKLMTSPPTPPEVAEEIRRLQDEVQEALITLDSKRRLQGLQIQRETAEWTRDSGEVLGNVTQKGTRVTKSRKFSGRTIVDEIDFPDETIRGGDPVFKRIRDAESRGTMVTERQLRDRLQKRWAIRPEEMDGYVDDAIAKLNALGEAMEKEAVRRADDFVASQSAGRKTADEILEAKQTVQRQIDELADPELGGGLGSRNLEYDDRRSFVYDPENPAKVQHIQNEMEFDTNAINNWLNDTFPNGLDTEVVLVVDGKQTKGALRTFLSEEQVEGIRDLVDSFFLKDARASQLGHHLKVIDDLMAQGLVPQEAVTKWSSELIPALVKQADSRDIFKIKNKKYFVKDGAGKSEFYSDIKEVVSIKKKQRDFDVFMNLDEVAEAVPALDTFPPNASVERLESFLNDWIEYETKNPSGIDQRIGKPINAESLTELRDRLVGVRQKDSPRIQRIMERQSARANEVDIPDSTQYLYRREFKEVLDEAMDMYFTALDTPMDMLGTGRKWSSKGGALHTRRVDDILVKLHTDSLDELKKSGLMNYADELEELGDIDIDIDLIESLDGSKLFAQRHELAGYADADLTTFTELFDFDSLVLSEQKAVSDFKKVVRLVDPERYDVQIVSADMAVLRKQVLSEARETGQTFENVMFGRMTSDGNVIEGPISKDAGKTAWGTKKVQATGTELGPKGYQDMVAQQLDDAMELMPSKWTQRLEDSFTMDGADVYGKRARDGANRKVSGYNATTKKQIEQGVIRRRGIVLGTDANSSKAHWDRAYYSGFERNDDILFGLSEQRWLNQMIDLENSPFMIGDDVINAGGFINIQGTGMTTSTMAHELTHMMQHQNGTFLALERGWYRFKALDGPKVDPNDIRYQQRTMNDIMGINEYNRQTTGGKIAGFRSSEVGIEDEFINPYAGKTYNTSGAQVGTQRVRGDIGTYGDKASDVADLSIPKLESPLEATTMGTEAMFITKVDEAGNFVDTGYTPNALNIWEKGDGVFGGQSSVKSEDTANWIFGLFGGV